MEKIPVGLQFYTVRDECAKNFVGTLKKVANIGYKGVELAGTYSLSANELKKVEEKGPLIYGTKERCLSI